MGSQSFGKGNFKALFEALEMEQDRRGNLQATGSTEFHDEDTGSLRLVGGVRQVGITNQVRRRRPCRRSTVCRPSRFPGRR